MPETKEKAQEFIDGLGLKDRAWISSAGNLQNNTYELEDTSLVIVVGGDGTILRAVRATSPFNVPVVGVKMGKVGFMAELSPEEAISKLPEFISYISKDAQSESVIRVEERMMIEAKVMPASGCLLYTSDAADE